MFKAGSFPIVSQCREFFNFPGVSEYYFVVTENPITDLL